jgi:hypothetical protein
MTDYICRLDGLVFATAEELQQHRATVHEGVPYPTEDDRLKRTQP